MGVEPMGAVIKQYWGDRIVYRGDEVLRLDQARRADIVNVAVGSWLAAGPFILGYTGSIVAVSSVIVGSLVALVGLFRALSPTRKSYLEWVNIIGGIWLGTAAFATQPGEHVAFWNTLIASSVIFIFATWSLMDTQMVEFEHWSDTYDDDLYEETRAQA